jgi:DmsE family decaheme c-type cytochrome
LGIASLWPGRASEFVADLAAFPKSGDRASNGRAQSGGASRFVGCRPAQVAAANRRRLLQFEFVAPCNTRLHGGAAPWAGAFMVAADWPVDGAGHSCQRERHDSKQTGGDKRMARACSSSFFRLWVSATLALLFGLSTGRAAHAEPDPMLNARIVGEQRCGECHDTERTLFGHTQHAKIFRENPANDIEKAVCEACHGPGSLHILDTLDRTKIIGFSKEWGTPVAKQTAQCLSCHTGGQRIHWTNSIHATNKLSCSDCHNPMARFSSNGLMKKASITETCQSCHQQQRAEFRKKSHMPLPEGKISCEDCHNPHGSSSKRLLKTDSVNELCYACHTEKRGPFLWEHAPVRENCLTCHSPHGSNQDKLLVQTRPLLCQQCHSGQGNMGHQMFAGNTLATAMTGLTVPASNPNAGSRRAIGRACQNCHTQIHGSNSPSGARFQR